MVKLVIFDLDGTLLDTESLVVDAARTVLAQHGHALTAEAQLAGRGRTPLDAWQATIDALGMEGVTAQQLRGESEPLLTGRNSRVRQWHRWHEARLMPGAGRLLAHLRSHGVATALATSTPRATLRRKLSGAGARGLDGAFQAVRCGDEVENSKPQPDCFLQTAAELGVDPAECLAIEDAPSGVEAATAAGMRVVAVPSLPDEDAYTAAARGCKEGWFTVLPSLLDFRPEAFGLPPFEDTVHGVVPIVPPWVLRGRVVKGFGRGSRELGIPTANLDDASLQGHLAEAVTGIYCGWASVGSDSAVHKMCMSIGWNPFYNNARKTAEPWILRDFEHNFYGEELRLLVCGYIRPEANFTSLDALVARIHEDARISKEALDDPALAALRADPSLWAQSDVAQAGRHC